MREEPDSSTPRIYLACSLSNVDPEDWRILEDDCEAIKRGAVAAAVEALDKWECYIHAPIDHTSPERAPSLEPRDIWRRNSREVICLADGLIAHGFKGGSCGVGQELTWAFERGLPILYVHHWRGKVSKQIRGMSQLSPWFDIFEFGDPDALERIVREWIVARRPVIENGPLHRSYTFKSWEPLRAELEARWEMFSRDERARVCAVARTDPEEIEHVLEHPTLLSVLPSAKLVALLSAFDLDPLLFLPLPLMGLTREERDALDACARRLGWGASFTHAVEFAGRRVKTRLSEAVTREEINLEQPEAWDEIARRWRSGDLA